jgi:2'-5' RNA ligase
MQERELRCFLAVDFDPGTQARLERVWGALREGSVPVRWVRREGLHATLAFFGDVSRATADALAHEVGEEVAHLPRIPVKLGGLGGFPHADKARVVWVGVEDPTHRLAEIQARLERRCQPLGFKPDERGFHPHVTLGRAKAAPVKVESLREAATDLSAAALAKTEGMIVRVVLFQSLLEPDGAVYVPLATFNLG